jgi:hypothetical protein
LGDPLPKLCPSLRKRVKATKQEQTGNDKFKAKIEDKGVQCNTMRSLIKDLKDEIEASTLVGDILFLSCPSVCHTVCQSNSSETTEQNFMKLGR